MTKYLYAFGVMASLALAGCGSSIAGNYSVLDRKEGTVQVTYWVQVSSEIPSSEAEAIAAELRGKESKTTMVNIHNGPQSVETMIYSCTDSGCMDTRLEK